MQPGSDMTGSRKNVRSKLNDVVFGPETPARLFVLQAGFMVLFAGRALTVPFYKLTPQPAGLFRPVPPIGFLDQMPPRGVVIAVQLLVIAATVAWFLVGRSPEWRARGRRIAFVTAWIGFLFLAALPASRGKIYHRDLLLVWGAAPLLLAPTDVSFRDRVPSRRAGWPVRSSIAFLSVAYFCTGFQKIKVSGLEWIFSDNLQWALYWGRVRGAPPPWRELAFFIADRPWLAQLSAAGIVVFEIGFPLALFFPRIRPAFIVAAWFFHGGTYLMLGLDYWFYAFVVTLVLVNWPPVIDRVRRTPVPAPT
ncbi:MAG: hypothetical protein EXQ79_09295 [Acidimicrobiia bacterium]|nr:hypothetical protein [Acidimicrobiia bacterium]